MTILEKLADDLDLPPALHVQAKGIYNRLSTHLQGRLSQYHPDIFSQGSFKLGTVIQPINGKEEYDLDFVCLFNQTQAVRSPAHLKQLLGDALKGNGLGGTLEEKQRCWRLNYSNFHVDILPAIPEDRIDLIYENVINKSLIQRPIKIPEKGMSNYKSSNPGGYAVWFAQQQARQYSDARVLLEKSIEELPDPTANKTVLQRVVQLMKRHRDIMFEDDPDIKPISIIITTLAAQLYGGQQDVLSAMKDIIDAMPERVSSKNIPNPVNPKENFADKWADEPEKQKAFNDWLAAVANMANGLQKAVQDSRTGVVEIRKILAENYGEDSAVNSLAGITGEISAARSAGKLTVQGTGIIGVSAGKSVRANTFYGD